MIDVIAYISYETWTDREFVGQYPTEESASDAAEHWLDGLRDDLSPKNVRVVGTNENDEEVFSL